MIAMHTDAPISKAYMISRRTLVIFKLALVHRLGQVKAITKPPKLPHDYTCVAGRF